MAAAEGGARSPGQRERLLFVWEAAAAAEVGREGGDGGGGPGSCPGLLGRPAHTASGARVRPGPVGGAPPPGPGSPSARASGRVGAPAGRRQRCGAGVGLQLKRPPPLRAPVALGHPCLARRQGGGSVT